MKTLNKKSITNKTTKIYMKGITTESNTEKKPKRNNIVKNNYVVAGVNHTITADCTSLKINGWLMLAIDLATRTIVGHCYSETAHNSQDVIRMFEEIFCDRKFMGRFEVAHFDKGTIFTAEEVIEFFKLHGVIISYAVAASFGNQPVERKNRTLKGILRKQIDPEWSEKKQREKLVEDPLDKKIDILALKELIKKSIEIHNDRKTRKTGLSPNFMENALVQYKGELPEIKTAQNGSPEARLIELFKESSAFEYVEEAQRWFIEFRKENQAAHERTIQEIRYQAEKTSADAEERHQNQLNELRLMKEDAEQKYQSIVTQNLELIARLKNTEEDAKLLADIERKKQEAKAKRQQAEKRPLRDIITADQFEALIKTIRNTKGPADDIQKARRIVAYFLLRLTGLRVSNLLTITVRQIKELFEEGTTKLELIKGGPKRFNLLIPQNQQEWFRGCSYEIDILCRSKAEGDPLFHATDPKKPMNRSNFDTDLNAPLKTLSETVGAVIKTHSFRATIISELILGGVNINEVATYMGHASAMSTAKYDRNPESFERLKEISKIINRKRSRAPKTVEDLVKKIGKKPEKKRRKRKALEKGKV
jgi:integrase